MRPTQTHRYPLKHVIAWLALIAFTVFMFLAIMGSAGAEKDDISCTGQETAGRCADKCPNQTDQLLGFYPQTRAAICKPAVVAPTSQNTSDTELPQFEDPGENWGK